MVAVVLPLIKTIVRARTDSLIEVLIVYAINTGEYLHSPVWSGVHLLFRTCCRSPDEVIEIHR